mmetsp:Transcript_9867/g.25136  ORF Transcript_9867/g.25136 Transcript_9867/m.25136 type:complete len:205 (-) Transcript_9867:354-968(-)
MITTINLPAFSGRFPTLMAARTAAPEEMPQRTPSSWARRRAIEIASSLEICTTSSYTWVLSTPGTKPAPMPWILCGPGWPPESTGDSVGSTATTCTPPFTLFRYSPAPVMVPPVPMPATRMSTSPAVSRKISGPVVRRCTAALAGFSNCCSTYELSVAAAISSAFFTAPPMPFAGSVSTSVAPNACSSTRRSRDMEAGMVRMSL